MNSEQLADEISSKLKFALNREQEFIALHEPSFKGNEWAFVKDCIDSGWVSSVGQYVNQFESSLSEWTGAPYAIAVMNGTAALHISLLLAGVEAGDEVLLPSLTFIATANAVHYCGAAPHFVEVTKETMGVDPFELRGYLTENAERKRDGTLVNKRTGRRIAAIVPMHTFGHSVHLDELIELSAQFGIPLVEDAAESLGSYYKGKHTGTFGLLSAVSFNGNKVITTGGGGAILTADPELAKRAKHLTTTAKVPHAWEFVHDAIGYNYRMPNLNAALGCAQMEQLPIILEKKRQLADTYAALFEDVPGISFMTEPEHGNSNYWLNAIILDKPDQATRNRILEKLNSEKMMARPIWKPMHKLPMFNQCPRMDMKVTEAMENSVINIPSSAVLVDRLQEENGA